MSKIIQIYKLLLPYLWSSTKVRVATLLTLCLIALDVLATTYFPYIWKNIIGANIHSTPPSWFIWTTIVLFTLWTIKKSAPHFREIVFFKVTNQAIKEIRLQTILKSHTISLLDLEKYNVQEIISATTRISQSIRQFMRVSFISIFPSTVKVISLSIALITSDLLCSGIVGAVYFGLISSAICLQYYTKAKTKGWHLTDTVTVSMGHSLQNTASVRFNLKDEAQHLTKLFDLEANAWEKHNTILHLLHLIQDFIFYIGSGIVFCILIVQYAQGTVPLEKLVLIYGLITSMYSPLIEITRNMTRFFGGIIDLNKTLAILNLPSENKPLRLARPSNKIITLKDLSFAYPHKKILFKDINLLIHPGDKIGIFGPSGAGKSTLCQIIAGLLPPTAGVALYDKYPLYKIQPEMLGSVLSYIPQEHLFQSFEPSQHEHGIHLKKQSFSGGEHQRYLLTKALEKKPHIIILDETTNALDRNAVDQVIDTVLATVPTVIMITHRQTTLDKMQHIFELKNGHLNKVRSHST